MEIAFAYGARLNEKSGNLRANGLADIVTKYPSHGFVIDRKEARSIFIDVQEPPGVLLQISEALHSQMDAGIDSASPSVAYIPPAASPGADHDTAQQPDHPEGSNPPSGHPISGGGAAEHESSDVPAANDPIPEVAAIATAAGEGPV
ncbi:hypothetical protein D3C71_1553020 [compost metagenome]